jgi:hypothetical protein
LDVVGNGQCYGHSIGNVYHLVAETGVLCCDPGMGAEFQHMDLGQQQRQNIKDMPTIETGERSAKQRANQSLVDTSTDHHSGTCNRRHNHYYPRTSTVSDDDIIRQYLQSLQPGEEVIETGSSCMTGKRGVVYISENEGVTFGSKCVRWDNSMGTSVTWGTRRVRDVENIS